MTVIFNLEKQSLTRQTLNIDLTNPKFESFFLLFFFMDKIIIKIVIKVLY